MSDSEGIKKPRVDPRLHSKFSLEGDPCYLEAQLVLNCNASAKDRDECKILAENVSHCRKFWQKVRRDRKRKGIKPPIPPMEERPQVIEEYKHVLDKIKNDQGCVIQ